MSPSTVSSQTYVLGNSTHEQQRLKLQASIVGRWTENYLIQSGLERGMRVLDLGCGMGDVALLAAEIVGPSGSVTAIDRDPVVLEKARARAAEQGHSAAVEFLHADLLAFTTQTLFDAVIGRYVLLYQPDPVRAICHLMDLLRPGGILCFHEMAFGTPPRGYPEKTLFRQSFTWIGDVFRKVGINPDMGLMLAKTFAEAGLPRPTIKGDVPVGGEAGSYLCGWGADTVRSLLPIMEKFAVVTAEEVQIETLAQRMEDEAVEHHGQLVGPMQFGAWTRKQM